MKLTDIMSHMDLSVFPQIGLVIFLAVFAAVVWRITRHGEQLEAIGRLPLEGEGTVPGQVFNDDMGALAQHNEEGTHGTAH